MPDRFLSEDTKWLSMMVRWGVTMHAI